MLPLVMGFLSFLIRDKFTKQVNLFYLMVFLSFFAYIVYCIFNFDFSGQKDYSMVVGGWAKSIGIELKFNLNCAFIVLFLTSIMIIFLSAIYRGFIGYAFRGFACIMLCGANGLVLTNDIFNCYVFFEIMCITTYIMYSYGNNVVCLKNTYDYTILSSFVGVIFLVVIAFLYQVTGNLNIDLMHHYIDIFYINKSISATYVFFILAMAIKIGLYPFHSILFGIYKNISLKYLIFIASVSSIVYPCFIIKIISQLFGNYVIMNNEYMNIVLKIFGSIGFIFFNFSAFITNSVINFIIFLSFSQISLFMFCVPYFIESQIINGIFLMIASGSVIKACMLGILYKIEEQQPLLLNFEKKDVKYITSNVYRSLFVILLFILSGMPISIVFMSKWHIISGIITVSDNILYLSIVAIGFAVDAFACLSFMKKILLKGEDGKFLVVKTDYLLAFIITCILILLIVATFFLIV